MARPTPILAKLTLAVLLASWLPLLLYIPFDWLRGGGGNPIGLGLLMVAGTLLAGVLVCLEAARQWVQRRRRRTHPGA